MTQRPTFWSNLVGGTGQALPLVVITALMGFGTLMVNMQIQMSELKFKQDETLRVLKRTEEGWTKTFDWIRAEVDDIDQRVRELEKGRR